MGKLIDRFRKLPLSTMVLHITSKFVFGLGLGALLVVYFTEYDWWTLGWSLIALSLIMAIPGAYRVLKK